MSSMELLAANPRSKVIVSIVQTGRVYRCSVVIYITVLKDVG